LLAINEDLVLSLDCQPPCQVTALPKKLKMIIESPFHHESESKEVFDCDEWAPSTRVFDPHPCNDPKPISFLESLTTTTLLSYQVHTRFINTWRSQYMQDVEEQAMI
jgi:hypothetical protein